MTHNMKLFLKTLAGLVSALGLCACMGCSKDGESSEIGNPSQKSRLVTVSPVRSEPLRASVEYVGSLCANLKVNVSTEIGGTIEKLYFERGDRVEKGQLLAEIGTTSIGLEVQQAEAALGVSRSQLRKTEKGSRPEEIRIAMARVEQAEAALKETEQNFRRIEDLHADRAVSVSEYDAAKRMVDTAKASLESAKQQLELARQGPRIEDRQQARASLKQAQASLAMAKDRLRKSRLHSPSDGVIAFRRVEEGEVVGTGTPITQVVDNSKMKIRLSLAERDLPLIERHGRFPFTVDAVPGEAFTSRLSFLSPTADLVTRSFPLELLVDEPDPRMADGMTVRVEFPLGNRETSIRIPTVWLSEEDGHIGLFVVEGEKAVFRHVTLGSYYEHKVEILSGLKDHDLVITNPAGLRSGTPVTYKSD